MYSTPPQKFTHDYKKPTAPVVSDSEKTCSFCMLHIKASPNLKKSNLQTNNINGQPPHLLLQNFNPRCQKSLQNKNLL